MRARSVTHGPHGVCGPRVNTTVAPRARRMAVTRVATSVLYAASLYPSFVAVPVVSHSFVSVMTSTGWLISAVCCALCSLCPGSITMTLPSRGAAGADVVVLVAGAVVRASVTRGATDVDVVVVVGTATEVRRGDRRLTKSTAPVATSTNATDATTTTRRHAMLDAPDRAACLTSPPYGPTCQTSASVQSLLRPACAASGSNASTRARLSNVDWLDDARYASQSGSPLYWMPLPHPELAYGTHSRLIYRCQALSALSESCIAVMNCETGAGLFPACASSD